MPPNRYIRYGLLPMNYNRTKTEIFKPNLVACSLFVFSNQIRLRFLAFISMTGYESALLFRPFILPSSIQILRWPNMSQNDLRYPKLNKFYQRFLTEENSASFIKAVSEYYLIGTLEKLYQNGDRITRRAAILAIGFLGDFSLNETMGSALTDDDRAVRLLAEHNIRQVWQRQGTPSEQMQIGRLISLNTAKHSTEAVELADQLLQHNDLLGEAWNQRAIAHADAGQFQQAVSDGRKTLDCNRYHFPAAVGMGHRLPSHGKTHFLHSIVLDWLFK